MHGHTYNYMTYKITKAITSTYGGQTTSKIVYLFGGKVAAIVLTRQLRRFEMKSFRGAFAKVFREFRSGFFVCERTHL